MLQWSLTIPTTTGSSLCRINGVKTLTVVTPDASNRMSIWERISSSCSSSCSAATPSTASCDTVLIFVLKFRNLCLFLYAVERYTSAVPLPNLSDHFELKWSHLWMKIYYATVMKKVVMMRRKTMVHIISKIMLLMTVTMMMATRSRGEEGMLKKVTKAKTTKTSKMK